MRSGFSSQASRISAVAAGCAFLSLAMAACHAEADSMVAKAPGASQSADIGDTAPPGPAVAAAQPTDDSRRFDLDCTARGEVVREDPLVIHASPNALEWDGSTHLIVDLETMRYCDAPVICRRYGPQPIQALTPDMIVLAERPDYSHTIGRSDGIYRVKLYDLARLSVTAGTCRRVPFSGFPDVIPGY